MRGSAAFVQRGRRAQFDERFRLGPSTVVLACLVLQCCGGKASSGLTGPIVPTPTPVQACVSLSTTNQTMSGQATVASVTVTAPASCSWTAISGSSFITVTSGGSGSGNGVVNYSVSAISNLSDRTGTLTIGGVAVTIVQQYCKYSISPATVQFPVGGGSVTATVTAPSACTWVAAYDNGVGFVQVTAGSPGIGPGVVTFAAGANDGVGRFETMTFGTAQATLLLVQSGPTPLGCTTSTCDAEPKTINVASSGGTTDISVVADLFRKWTATTNASFVTIVGSNTGEGPAPLRIAIAPNGTGAIRSGTVAFAGTFGTFATVTVIQSGS
jgi:hypothetical protein